MNTAPQPTTYCTYFDSGYLTRGLALIQSLRNHGDNSRVYVLALDEGVKQYFLTNPSSDVEILTLSDLEASEPGLLAIRSERSRMEYYFTCTPLLIRHVMNLRNSRNGITVYLDGDLNFFDNPQLVVDAMRDGSVGIIEHRYTARLSKKLAKYGRFNVGWVGFRDDARGRKVLDRYAAQTLEWCSDRPTEGKYADQGYLDQFPQHDGVMILTSAGFNLAPWNVQRHNLTVRADRVFSDDEPVVFFHFHGLRRFAARYATGEMVYGTRLTKTLREYIYRPYILSLNAFESLVQIQRLTAIKSRGSGLAGLAFRFKKWVLYAIALVSGNTISASESRG